MEVNKADREAGPGGKTVSMIGSGSHIRRRLRRVFLLDFLVDTYLADGGCLPRATGRLDPTSSARYVSPSGNA